MALRLAVCGTILDVLISFPFILMSHFPPAGDADVMHRTALSFERIWRILHQPTEWLAGDILFPTIMNATYQRQWTMHDSVPSWFSVMYYFMCFFQTFLLVFLVLHAAKGHK